MELEDFLDAGSDIFNAVSKAVEDGEYSHLSDTIKDRVSDLGAQITEEVAGAAGYAPKSGASRRPKRYQSAYEGRDFRTVDSVYGGKESTGSTRPRADEPIRARKTVQSTGNLRRSPQSASLKQTTSSGSSLVPSDSHFLQTGVSRSSGAVRKIVGLVGTAAGGIGAATSLAGLVAGGILGFGVATVVSAVFLGVSGGVAGIFAAIGLSGRKRQKLIEKYFEYGDRLGNAEDFAIEDLARASGTSENQVRKDVIEMKRQGLLPYMAMDQQKSTVMLTEKAYNQYQQAEMSRKEREARSYMDSARKKNEKEAGKKAEDPNPVGYRPAANAQQENAQNGGDMAESERIVREGEKYTQRIRYINDLIPDDDSDGMSAKLYRLESIMRRIFGQIKKQPASARDMRRMMDYYLPTTEKLLNAYVELDKQPQIGENIKTTKQEIASSMDTINDAFEKMFDDMFRDVAWDISSDISVMKTMMAQDGLVRDDQERRQ